MTDTKLDGVNLLPYLAGDNKSAPHDALYWRFGQQTAIRMGNWKLIKHSQSESRELYDLSQDIGESNDLAKQHPDKFAELESAWKKWDGELVEPTWGGRQAGARRANNKKKAAE